MSERWEFWENLPKPARKRHAITSIRTRSSEKNVDTNLFEPHDGKHDIGERGHLFDVDHLANGQVDLYSGLGSHGDSHFLWTRDKNYSRTLPGARGETIVVGKGQPGDDHTHTRGDRNCSAHMIGICRATCILLPVRHGDRFSTAASRHLRVARRCRTRDGPGRGRPCRSRLPGVVGRPCRNAGTTTAPANLHTKKTK